MRRLIPPRLRPAVGAAGFAWLLTVGVVGCATGTGGETAPVLSLAPEIREYLIDPSVGMEDIPGGSRSQISGVFERLRVGDVEGAKQGISGLAVVGGGVRRVLEAQLAFVEDRREEARQILGPDPTSDAGRLLSARLYELDGDSAAAVAVYWSLRETRTIAVDRVSTLLPQALDQRAVDFDRALANRNFDQADAVLEELRTWAPERELTRRSAVRYARATGDLPTELVAWRDLARVAPPSREEMFRWAELELTDGNADQALEISRALVASAGDDAQARELLARAEFNWRSRLLPDKARTVLASPSLTRAELAVALYWLFPQARYAPSRAVRIASDILESPHREEIVQVVNAGLLDVDNAGHRFRPEVAAIRSDAAGCVAEMLRTGGAGCAAGSANSGACSVLAACDVVTADRCTAGEGISGAEFSEWARRAQERLTRP